MIWEGWGANITYMVGWLGSHGIFSGWVGGGGKRSGYRMTCMHISEYLVIKKEMR